MYTESLLVGNEFTAKAHAHRELSELVIGLLSDTRNVTRAPDNLYYNFFSRPGYTPE